MAGKKYVLAIDQSTQGTKGILFDAEGQLICRRDIAHEQIVNEKGWVSHDLDEIYRNTLQVVQDVVTEAMAFAANPTDETYLIPAFSGLGAPYWKVDAKAMLYGMSRTTGKNEIVCAALESIAYASVKFYSD